MPIMDSAPDAALAPMSWTQAACDTCWDALNPGREAVRVTKEQRDVERCCYCGDRTFSGIYVRENPKAVPYPREVPE